MSRPLSDRFRLALWHGRWLAFSAATVRAFHAYANWLVGITWRRFTVLAALLLILVAIVHDMPPFTWTIETVDTPQQVVVPPRPPTPSRHADGGVPGKGAGSGDGADLQIHIGKDGIHITRSGAASAPASGASAAEPGIHIGSDGIHITGAASAPADNASAAESEIEIRLPRGAAGAGLREAIADAKRQLEEALREQQAELRERREEAEQAARDAEEARREAEAAVEELTREQGRGRRRTSRLGVGNFMMQFAWVWVIASAAIKATYKGRVQAEVKAAQATETAEAESLRRQVAEARMAAMQAQVEPHFLFNTLASIDHLIETDPARASQMQRNLIALLRASMPTMREASGSGGGNAGGVRDLGRELAVIRPYLEILKVRMEERLATAIDVPEGLLSAEFPPMMIQTLVENAIKHGLEPKAEGGTLSLKAEIVHGKLQVTVADTGMGFGRAATAGTGVGLANIRERLQLLYGTRAALTVAENQPSGTVVTITVPYRTTAETPA